MVLSGKLRVLQTCLTPFDTHRRTDRSALRLSTSHEQLTTETRLPAHCSWSGTVRDAFCDLDDLVTGEG